MYRLDRTAAAPTDKSKLCYMYYYNMYESCKKAQYTMSNKFASIWKSWQQIHGMKMKMLNFNTFWQRLKTPNK